jgi:hypothetical protein
MRTPPPVHIPLGRDLFWEAACAALPVLAGFCLVWWIVLHAAPLVGYTPWSGSLWRPSDLTVGWFALVPMLLGWAAGWAGWRWARVEPLQLAWTGQVWQARPVCDGISGTDPAFHQVGCLGVSAPNRGIEAQAGAPWGACEPALMIDLDAWMLLRLRWPYDGSPKRKGEVWRAVSASQVDPWSWHGLRVALHCARLSAAGHGLRP